MRKLVSQSSSILVATCLGACGSQATGAKPVSRPEPSGEVSARASPTTEQSAELQAKVERFAVAELTADVSDLPESERRALDELIAAARLLDPVFDRQAWTGNPALARTLAEGDERWAYEYFTIMRGPWDRQHEHEPFAVDHPRPPGAGYYPEDMDKTEFEAWLAAHPQERAAFESLYTVIERDGEGLVARPYSEVYRQWLEPAAQHLRNAAELTANASLARFLRARADAFSSDDYYVSDKAWMDVDSRIEITIGPYETYEDQLLNLKAAFEAFVTVSDPEASAKLARFKRYLPAMEDNLPIADHIKTKRGAASPIRVVDVVYTSGDARTSVQTIAFNLPNDERVRKEKGAKKVLLRNLIETKFDRIMRPIGERILDESLHEQLSAEAFFNQTLFHELSHSLGPAFTQRRPEAGGKPEKVEIRVALGPAYSPLEEAKADVLGAYNILFMVDNDEFPESFREQLLTSYFAGLFRSVRFGVTEAHGRGAAAQINRYLRDGAAVFDPQTHTFTIDFDALDDSITKLAHDLIMLQHDGDPKAAETFLVELGIMSEPMRLALEQVEDIPIDIRPVYPLAGEG